MGGGTPDEFPFPPHLRGPPSGLALFCLPSLLHLQTLCGQCMPLKVALKDRGVPREWRWIPRGQRAQPEKQRGGQRERGPGGWRGCPPGRRREPEGLRGSQMVESQVQRAVSALGGVRDPQSSGTLEGGRTWRTEKDSGGWRRVSCMAEGSAWRDEGA